MSKSPRKLLIENALSQGHSQEYIQAVLMYSEKLWSKGAPVIYSLQHFAMEIGMQSDFINYLIYSRNDQYSFFLLRKKNKMEAPREIMAPKEELKYLQRWINFNILQKLQYNQYIQGFTPDSSILKHAQIHHKSKYLLKVDLLKFFDCITEKDVYKAFRSIGYIKNLAWDFATLCTAKHTQSYWESFDREDINTLCQHINSDPATLPQGAPTSPLLANLVASRLDRRLGRLAEVRNFKYTRYADDLCFSTDYFGNLPSLDLLKRIIEDEGFFINRRKINYSKPGMKQYVTGLNISNPNKISVSKKKRRQIFAHLYYAQKFGIESHLQKLKVEGKKYNNYQNWLLGNISFQYSIDRDIGKKMFDIYNKIGWSIDLKLEQSEAKRT